MTEEMMLREFYFTWNKWNELNKLDKRNPENRLAEENERKNLLAIDAMMKERKERDRKRLEELSSFRKNPYG